MKYISNRHHISLFIGIILLLSGCSLQQQKVIFSKATIQNDTTWEIKEKCGYENCYPLLDYIEGEGISVRIKPNNGYDSNGVFTINTMFSLTEVGTLSIDPHQIYVELGNGEIVNSVPFKCGSTDYHNYLMENHYGKKTEKEPEENILYKYLKEVAKPLQGTVEINNPPTEKIPYQCIYLFFDAPPPSEEDLFHLNIKGIKKSGKEIKLPSISFGPSYSHTPKRQGRPVLEE